MNSQQEDQRVVELTESVVVLELWYSFVVNMSVSEISSSGVWFWSCFWGVDNLLYACNLGHNMQEDDTSHVGDGEQ